MKLNDIHASQWFAFVPIGLKGCERRIKKALTFLQVPDFQRELPCTNNELIPDGFKATCRSRSIKTSLLNSVLIANSLLYKFRTFHSELWGLKTP